jgi:Ssp1 endopeptidase immunity protein Rap1a
MEVEMKQQLVPTDTCLLRHNRIKQGMATIGRAAPVAVLLMLFFTGSAFAQTQGHRDGNSLLESCNAALKAKDDSSAHVDRGAAWYCIGYVQGIRESLDAQRLLSSSTHADDPSGISIPEEVENGQVIRVVVRWLQNHPESLHEEKIVIMIWALREAFPATQTARKQ